MTCGRNGLTLAEVMAALGILAIVAVSMIAAFVSGYKVMQQSTDLTMATDVAREHLETIKALDYHKTEVGIYDGKVPTPPDLDSGFPPAPYPSTLRGNTEFVLRTECVQHSVNTRFIKVVVTWGSVHKTEMGTLLHR